MIYMADIYKSRNGFRQTSRVIVALTCIVMYAMATAHWALSLRMILADDTGSQVLQTATSECLENMAEGEACTLTLDDVFSSLGPIGRSCETTSLLIVNVSVKPRSDRLNCSSNLSVRFC